ncbi:MAG: Fur family transcriptional regulator [Armatimonadetes bacterium]|jgi:Fur family peroxide stress response transcriptional regulator|nr:Fur family transcriptional regulator [Armatimonadota bacterium]
MLPLEDLLQRCRERGVKLTPQRIAIFECLGTRRGHLSAEEVYQDVLARYPTLSFATVYNTLQLLTEMEEVREVIVDELRRRYDVNTEPHHHAVCRRCHTIVDIVPELLGASWPALPQEALPGCDFRVEAVSVEFTGLCGACERAPAATVSDR